MAEAVRKGGTTMVTSDRYDDIVNRFITERREVCDKRVNDLNEWHAPWMTRQQFWLMLQASAQSIMAKRGVHRAYVVDDFNRQVIIQMYYYVTGSPECIWNINKGIYLGGKVGCGKTVLLQALCDILHFVSGYTVEMIPANQLYKRIQQDGIMSLSRRPLFIDELGREQLEINDFGNRIRPINDLMEARYEAGVRTFFTSNFSLENLSKGRNDKGEKIGYGKYVGERIQETTNIVIMPGDSRREKWESKL